MLCDALCVLLSLTLRSLAGGLPSDPPVFRLFLSQNALLFSLPATLLSLSLLSLAGGVLACAYGVYGTTSLAVGVAFAGAGCAWLMLQAHSLLARVWNFEYSLKKSDALLAAEAEAAAVAEAAEQQRLAAVAAEKARQAEEGSVFDAIGAVSDLLRKERMEGGRRSEPPPQLAWPRPQPVQAPPPAPPQQYAPPAPPPAPQSLAPSHSAQQRPSLGGPAIGADRSTQSRPLPPPVAAPTPYTSPPDRFTPVSASPPERRRGPPTVQELMEEKRRAEEAGMLNTPILDVGRPLTVQELLASKRRAEGLYVPGSDAPTPFASGVESFW